MKLCRNWIGKVERDEMDVKVAWDLLRERVAAIDPAFTACPTCGQQPCPDPSFCASCRAADAKIAASRKCAQCGAGGELEPHKDNERRKVIYLHASCVRFWRSRHR